MIEGVLKKMSSARLIQYFDEINRFLSKVICSFNATNQAREHEKDGVAEMI